VSREKGTVQANLGRKLRVQSTAGTVFLPTNMTRSPNKLRSTGQGPSGVNLTSGGKLTNLAAGPREVVNQ